MELQFFKVNFEEALEYLIENLYEIKYKIFAPEDEGVEAFTTYAEEDFESFYKRAYIELTNANSLVDKIYKFIVSDSEKPGYPEKAPAVSELFNCLANFSEELRVINERLEETYLILTGIGSENPEASYNLESVDGYTNFLLDKVESAIDWTREILEYLTGRKVSGGDVCEEPAAEEKSSGIVSDRLDYCD